MIDALSTARTPTYSLCFCVVQISLPLSVISFFLSFSAFLANKLPIRVNNCNLHAMSHRLRVIDPIFAIDKEVPLFDALVGGGRAKPKNSGLQNLA